MATNMKLYLFGDQTFDIQPHLRNLLQKRDHLFLQDFLTKAYNAIRVEMYRLPLKVRNDLPRFTCQEDLLLWDQSGKRCVALDMAMTTMYHLGTFISQAGIDSYDAHKTRVVGLCTGAFAAAAVSCSSFTADLIPMAVDAVVAAFRTGVLVTEVAKRVDQSHDLDDSWAILVPGTKSAEAVLQFCEQSNLPLTSRPYISAYAPSGVTVSGPPKTLAQLVASPSFKGLVSKSIPIHGAYHAPHLYSQLDAKSIVSKLYSTATPLSEQIPLLSSTGITLEERSFATLLEDAVAQALMHPLHWSSILKDVQSCLQEVNPEQFTVVPIGSTADNLIYNALKQTPLRSLVPSTPAQSRQTPVEPAPESGSKRAKLAIVAMSGRFPGAKDDEAYWDLLFKGLDVHKPVPSLRWDAQTHVDPTGTAKNTSASPFGCWLDDPAEFDARFFNISPREAPQIDPAQRLALMTAYEAIEQAGIVPDATPSTRPDRVGVFYGVTSNDWMETNSAQAIDTYFIPGGNRAFIPGRINYFFKFSGPSYAVDTACSSSLAGIHLACNSLWRGDVDTAIAGGTNVLTNPDFTAGLDRGHFLSRTGNCKTFDDGADGYCRGEGVATIIIKRLDDALAENDPILGVILGAYTNHSAESESITRPHVGAQRAIFSKILSEAAVDPYSVSYVEMHGTGTQAGDAAEMSSVLDTFAPPVSGGKRARSDEEALYIGSAKANIGHGEAASGVCGVVKVLQMMKKNTIPPHCGIKTKINHRFPTDLSERNVRIAMEPTAWEKRNSTQLRRVFVNNFSAAGGNSALLLEDAPPKADRVAGDDSRVQYPVAVTAKSGVSLQGNMRSMLKFLRENRDISLGDLSYTSTARRIHHQHRVLLSGATVDDICTKIETGLQNNTGVNRPKSAPSVVFTFTGQGAQYPGMGKQLFEENSFVRTELRQLDQIAQNLGFPSMLPVIQSEEQDISKFGPSVVQLASVCLQITLSKLWASWDIHPAAVVGHSLGEYAALNVAGVLSDTDTLFLVGKRAQLLEQKCTRGTHSMLVVKGSQDEIASVLKGHEYETACINSQVETVLAGTNEQVAGLKDILTAASMKSTLLKVPFAFHSSQLDPVLEEFEQLAAGVTFSKPTVPVLRPLDGTVVDHSDAFGAAYLAKHSRQPVNMLEALSTAYRDRVITDRSIILELGPHPAITGMVKPVLGQQMTCIASLQRGRQPWEVLLAALKGLYDAGANIRWAEYQRDFQGSHSVVSLPAYSWDLKDYWIQYVNDWSLRKGDAPLVINASKLESTTIHSVVEESGDSKKTHMIVEADIARADLSPLVQGHEVDGIPLCTPSVYADMALTLGKYLLDRYQPQQKARLVDVSDMTISKALILKDDAVKQPLQAHVEADWSSQSAAVKYMSFDNKGNLQEHSRCVLRFRDGSYQKTLQDSVAGVKQKLQALRTGIATGETARFNRPMVYRAIRPLARFHDDYRAIDEIVLNSNTLEACSRLSFGSVKRDGNFHTHPAVIDSLTQACGFAMNCNDSTDLDVEVFMNHGWGSLQLYEPLDFNKEYVTYTQMREGDDKLWHGDVVILDGDRVVAFFGSIAIQGVPRRVLKVILSLESGKKTQRPAQDKPRTLAPSAPSATLPSALQKPTIRVEKTQPSNVSKALVIISEESGIDVADLTDNTNFNDVGIDSLLGLTISARFREELDVDLDFNALFFEHPTVKDLKEFLQGPGYDDGSATSSSAASDSGLESPPSGLTTGLATPSPGLEEDFANPFEIEFSRALEIISEESGVAQEDLEDDTNFADCGVDSLLSLVIASRFQDTFGLDVRHEQLFLDCQTVGDLKEMLMREMGGSPTAPEAKPAALPTPEFLQAPTIKKTPVPNTNSNSAILATRQKAVDELVQKYTAGFSAPTSSRSAALPADNEKVVLVTGASGGLGSHLVYSIAQLEDVKTVVCLNRENRDEAYARQYKAMREKGIRFPENLKHKIRVFQQDTSKPKFGLDASEYESLVSSVTHLIHNAWPMSAKRPLSGFESQFQVFRNLVDFGNDVASRRPQNFKFSFQMVSSIGVVGQYGVSTGQTGKITVPEQRATIDCLLSNGYAEAKWGCERMLDETLHRYPDRFRAMVVRLGQIAGSKTSGYWNPMEHFGFLIKSSQTLNALPDVDGHLNWTPVNDIADTLSDLVLSDRKPHPFYHIDNPVGQQWRDVNAILSDTLRIPTMLPFKDWLQRVRAAPQQDNPAALLADFLEDTYLRMACGGLVLDVKNTVEHSKTLAAVGPVPENVVRKYIHIWKEIGFLKTTEEDKAGFEAERLRLWGPRV